MEFWWQQAEGVFSGGYARETNTLAGQVRVSAIAPAQTQCQESL